MTLWNGQIDSHPNLGTRPPESPCNQNEDTFSALTQMMHRRRRELRKPSKLVSPAAPRTSPSLPLEPSGSPQTSPQTAVAPRRPRTLGLPQVRRRRMRRKLSVREGSKNIGEVVISFQYCQGLAKSSSLAIFKLLFSLFLSLWVCESAVQQLEN